MEKEIFRQPAGWEIHESVWLAWPSHENLWEEDLLPAQDEFVAFCEAVADVDKNTGWVRGDRLQVLVPDLKAAGEAETRLGHLPVKFHHVPFGDIWLRDTAPIFLRNGKGARAAACFRFNSWGGKYDLPDDLPLARRIAKSSGLPVAEFPFVLEGGSVEVDGEGTCLTSRQCLLNPNRNPGMSQAEIEAALNGALGTEKVLWLGDGLLNDHTDGHIDTIARFVAPGRVVCMEARGPGDPNAALLEKIAADLRAMTDAKGRRLQVETIPSPGPVFDYEGKLMPASYVNFYISNSTVVVPVYGTCFDEEAVRGVARLFPGRRTIGLLAKSILTGGGAFHCISQQQPL
jgi:agmatine deiminase